MAARPLRATYRLQLTPEFGFADAARQIPYLRDLGVSHVYLSPALQARAGSTHGYDVVDPTALSADLGGEAAFRSLVQTAHGAGLGIVLDVVPNHMATDPANRFWTDPELRARFFDLDPDSDPPNRHRRFFDIDDLAGVRQEDPEVFEATHALVLSLVREGLVDALRIDHPDGLADPLQYLERLRAGGAETVWVEKILTHSGTGESDEALRDWPVAGTVGYEFLNDVCGVFVDPGAEERLTSLWREVSGDARTFDEVAQEAKLEQARGAFAPEVSRLAGVAHVDGGAARLAAAVASFPVYRSYVRADRGEVADADRAAVADARPGLPDDVAAMLLLERPAPPEFVTRFQQTTPAVVAKGIEDTAFYRYGRLLALCDVGGNPGRFGLPIDRFHAANAERAARFPQAMLTTMTHDTKRSSDVRARIVALTWLGDEWEARVRDWLALTERLRSADGAPDNLERYLLLQTLVGAWPIELSRMQGYMVKALREAKRNTDWVAPNAGWEDGVAAFCAAVYGDAGFLAAFEPFAARVAALGERIALGALTLKLTAPGVPDIYQGDELELRALVDPDNRRPVDWGWHHAMLAKLQGGAPPDPSTRKLWLTVRLLGLRIRHPRAFAGGAYEPLDAGPSVVGFTRGGEVLVAVAVRPDADVAAVLPAGGERWREVLAAPGVAVLERA